MNRGTLLKLGISLVFVALLVRTVSGGDLVSTISRVKPSWLLSSLGVTVLMFFISTLKWHYILRLQGHRVPFFSLVRQYLIGYYFSNLLPSNVGGDVVRATYIGKTIGSTSTAMVSVFLERVTGLVLLLILALATPLITPNLIKKPEVIAPLAVAFGGLIVIVAMFALRDPISIGRKFFPTRILVPIFNGLDAFHQKLLEALKCVKARPSSLLPITSYTLTFYILTWINVYVSFRAFGLTPAWNSVITITPIVMLVSALPLAPLGNLGFAEFSYTHYFSLVGVANAPVIAMALLLRFKLIILAICGMIAHMTYAPDERYTPTT